MVCDTFYLVYNVKEEYSVPSDMFHPDMSTLTCSLSIICSGFFLFWRTYCPEQMVVDSVLDWLTAVLVIKLRSRMNE
jgi:hypothetical protein